MLAAVHTEPKSEGKTVTRRERFQRLLDATRVYAITDHSLSEPALMSATMKLLDAGIRVFQFRDKQPADARRVALATRLGEMIHAAGGMLIVNDRVDIAIAAGADGAHLGQDDLPFVAGRAMLGPDRVLGVSASYLDEIGPACAAGIDYLGFGAVFATGTKPDAEYAGLELFARACQAASVPVVGVGGISIARAPSVVAAGGRAVAVVSALYQADDPFGAAQQLLETARAAG